MRLDRKTILNEIGFAWKDDGTLIFKLDEKLWHQQYEKLLEYKRINGHCMVPSKYKDDKSLGLWVMNQRKNHNNNRIRLDRKLILDEIGFAWKDDGVHTLNQIHKLWHQQYEKLLEYKRKKGNCLVPHRYKQDKSLGIWVRTQRKNHNDDKMRQDRKDLLDEIGFAWKPDGGPNFKPDDKLWHQHFDKIVEFKQMNGHCLVPQTKYKDDKSLGLWVMTQRARHANKKMLPDRKELLDALGFAWKADTVATRSSTTNVRGVTIRSFHAFGRSCSSLLTLVLYLHACLEFGFGSVH
jgi:hypothetical protein